MPYLLSSYPSIDRHTGPFPSTDAPALPQMFPFPFRKEQSY